MVFDKWYLIKGIRKMVFDKVYLIKSISAITNYNSSSCFFLQILKFICKLQIVINSKKFKSPESYNFDSWQKTNLQIIDCKKSFLFIVDRDSKRIFGEDFRKLRKGDKDSEVQNFQEN